MDTPKTVTVESIQDHTYEGHSYPVGSTYEIDEQYVGSVIAQGKAVRADRVQHAKQQADAAEKARQAASHPVEPMGTENSGLTPKK